MSTSAGHVLHPHALLGSWTLSPGLGAVKPILDRTVSCLVIETTIGSPSPSKLTSGYRGRAAMLCPPPGSGSLSQELPWILSIEGKDVAGQALAMRARQFPPDFTAARALRSTAVRLGVVEHSRVTRAVVRSSGREYLLRLGDSLQAKAAKRGERHVKGGGEGG
jgi:hypothetical protein